jgi:hypothetical protein
MFNRDKCAGCRKIKFFVKYREIKLGHGIGNAMSKDKLCRSCFKKLKKFTKNG